MPLFDPPHDEMRLVHLLEPLAAFAVEAGVVHCLPHKLLKGFDTLPDREVGNDHRILVDLKARRIPLIVLEPPDEARHALTQAVDTVEIVEKLGRAWIALAVAQLGYI